MRAHVTQFYDARCAVGKNSRVVKRENLSAGKLFITNYSSQVVMGKDHTKKQHKRVSHRTAPKSNNVYLDLLVKLYTYLARMYIQA